MRTFFIAGLSALLIGGPALAQDFGQSSRGQQAPGQQSPGQQIVRPPQSVGKPELHPGKPATAGTPAAQSGKASTPESRSAAALALSPDPVCDDGGNGCKCGFSQGQAVLALTPVATAARTRPQSFVGALTAAPLFPVVASALGSGWVASQSVRAAASGSIPIFCHHDDSSPQRWTSR